MIVVKLATIPLLLLAAAFPGGVRSGRDLTGAWIALLLYLAADACFLFLDAHIPLADIIVAYNGYYAFLLIAPMALWAGENISETSAILFLCAVFFICWIIGTAQFITQRPLLYTQSANGDAIVLSWFGPDGMRAFSLFCGDIVWFFCCLLGAIGIGIFLKQDLLDPST